MAKRKDAKVHLKGVSAKGEAREIKPPEPQARIVEAVGIAAGAAMVTGRGTLTIHEPIPRDHPHLALIGRIAVEWAAIEHQLDTLIWRLANVPPTIGACITAQVLGAGPRFLTVIALCTHARFAANVISKIRTTMQNGMDPGDKRNRALHDPWYLEQIGQTPAQLRAMPRSDLTYGFKPMPKAELNRILATITNYAQEVSDLRNLLLAELSSREEPRRS